MSTDIDEHLDEVLGVIELPKKEITKVEKVKPPTNGHDEDTDFQYARENLYNLIERGQDGLEELLEIAKQSEHPRAFEVCLLYTSPSPRDRQKSRMPSSA